MSVTLSPVVNTQSFGTWLARTSQVLSIMSTNTFTTDTSATGGINTGNATLTGILGSSQTLFSSGDIRGGNLQSSNTLTISSNASFIYNGNSLPIFNITSNSTISAVSSNVSSISLNTSGNSNFTANNINLNSSITTLNSTFATFNGSILTVNGTINAIGRAIFNSNSSYSLLNVNATSKTLVANLTSATLNVNTTITGTSFVVNANTTLSGNLSVSSGVSLLSSLNVAGNTSLVNTSITGPASFSNTVGIVGLLSTNGQIVNGSTNTVTLNVGSNISVNSSTIYIGNTTSNVVITGNSLAVSFPSSVISINSTGISVNSVNINTTAFSVGNTIANSTTIYANNISTYNMSVSGTISGSFAANGNILPQSNNLLTIGNISNTFASVFGVNVYSNYITSLSSNLTIQSNTIINGTLIANGALTVNGIINTASAGIKFTDGTSFTTANIVSGLTSYVQYNNGGVFGSNSNFTYTPATQTLYISNTISTSTISVNNVASNNISTNSITGNTLSVNSISTNSVTLAFSNINSLVYSFANSSQAIIDSFAVTSYRSVDYFIEITDTSSGNKYQLTRILLLQDGSSTYTTEYGSVWSSVQLGIFTSSISSGNVNIYCTPYSANSVIKLIKTQIVV